MHDADDDSVSTRASALLSTLLFVGNDDSTANLRRSMAAGAQESVFELCLSLSKRPGLFEAERLAVRMGRLQGQITLLRTVEENR